MPPRVKTVKHPKALPIDRKASLGVAHQRMVRRLTKALICAIAIIRNDAYGEELFGKKQKAKIRLRWASELEKESGVKAS